MGGAIDSILAWVTTHKDALAILVPFVIASVGAIGSVFVYFTKKKDQSASLSLQVHAGIAAGHDLTIRGSTVTIGITLAQHDARLRAREAEIRAELGQASTQSRAVLEAELQAPLRT